jgi:hypothetical protein
MGSRGPAHDRGTRGRSPWSAARELRPGPGCTAGDAFDPPALADRLHLRQSEAASGGEVQRTRGDHASTAGILDLNAQHARRKFDADNEGLR